MYNLQKVQPEKSLLKDKYKTEDLKTNFRSFNLHLLFNRLLLVVLHAIY